MSSTIEILERELAKAQAEREEQERAMVRAQNAYEAACLERDEEWYEAESGDPELERLKELVYRRRRELYRASERMKGAEGKERRVKSRLKYVLPAEQRRYFNGKADEGFHEFMAAVERRYSGEDRQLEVRLITQEPGHIDLEGDSGWRALERLNSGTLRRWVRIEAGDDLEAACAAARCISYYAGAHLPRVFVSGREIGFGECPAAKCETPEEYKSTEGELALARITAHCYLGEKAVGRLWEGPGFLLRIAGIARLCQDRNLTPEEIGWRLDQLTSLRLEVLEAVLSLSSEGHRLSFYEISRAARLLDGAFREEAEAAEALKEAARRARRDGVPLMEVIHKISTLWYRE